ncbi:hypothetical protein EIP91_005872 [Steccherinum ochraceum]|uniref:Uncharacterized protein n=1 Tax=Steccherinum ochraceum TaxID=92696 RepID=A0A4R0RCJ2_9APHY|nr:hypothetical protein EIP91_005872 [Steccherinum ochraceum]
MARAIGTYELLPTNEDTPLPTPAVQHDRFSWGPRNFCSRLFAFRRARYFLGFILLALCLLIPYRLYERHASKYPPLYEKYHAKELALPQHNPDLPYPEGREGKYLWVSAHLDGGFGWGNFMQELILDAYLAHKDGRAFVFDNYTWDRHGPEYSEYHGHLIPSRIPLTALLAGPIVGGPFPGVDHSPRSVRKEYFDTVCPDPVKIKGNDLIDTYVWGPTTILVEKWLERLELTNSKCIEVVEGSQQMFSLWTFGTTNVLSLWPDLVKSPIITGFRWSPLVEAGYAKNIPLINPPSVTHPSHYGETYPYTALGGLLALQIRRGDFEEHCVNLLNWGANWQGFNRFPELPDQFVAVPGAGTFNISDEARAEHLKRCYPTPGQIADRVREIMQTDAGRNLENVYIMTNGQPDFIAEVKEALRGVKAWGSIKSSRDLIVTREQDYVKQAIDMLIGIRAQVLIGNGWSSMSSNIVMLRMALVDLAPDHHRFWFDLHMLNLLAIAQSLANKIVQVV